MNNRDVGLVSGTFPVVFVKNIIPFDGKLELTYCTFTVNCFIVIVTHVLIMGLLMSACNSDQTSNETRVQENVSATTIKTLSPTPVHTATTILSNDLTAVSEKMVSSPTISQSEAEVRITTFDSTGESPRALMFDGEYIWATMMQGNTVSKMSLDGDVVGVYSVGNRPRALAFDGENVWVANGGDNTVMKITPEGDLLDIIRIGTGRTAPSGLLFDGEFIWVAASWGNNITKLNLDGEVVKSIPIPGSHPSPWALAWDGEAVWVASIGVEDIHKIDRNGNLIGAFTITKYIPHDLGPWSNSWSGGPAGITFDGNNIWVANGQKKVVSKVTKTGEIIGEYPVGGWPMSIMFDGRHIWVTMYLNAELIRMSLNGTILGRFEMLRGPYDLVFDGQSVWVANLEDNALTRIDR